MNLIYRKGNQDDFAQLKDLGIESFKAYKDLIHPIHAIQLDDYLQNDNYLHELLRISTCFVCINEQHLVGMAFLIPHGNPTDEYKNEWAYIRMVSVHPMYQGKNIAKQLVKNCMEHAVSKQERTIALVTSEHMLAAQHIYKSLGFIKTHETAPWFGMRYWLYLYQIAPQ